MMNSLKESSYMKIYDAAEKILGSKPIYILGAIVDRTSQVTDKKLEALVEYAKGFEGDPDRGKLRTMLVILKPYKNHPIIKETAELLANQLRVGSTTGFI
jgi:hypothetical protein